MAEKDAVYQIIADRIDSALAAGVAPWRKAWKTDGLSASNLFSKHAYSGVNVWLLAAWSMTRPEGAPAPFYATFNQVRAKGGHVKKGEKGIPVVFWRFLKREDKDTGKEVKIPLLRYYTVFNVEAQTEGLEKAKSEGKIEKFTLTGRQITVYVRRIEPAKPLLFSYQLKANYPVKAKTPKSAAYEYYNPKVRSEVKPVELMVTP